MNAGIGENLNAFADKLAVLGERLEGAETLSDILVELFGTTDVKGMFTDYVSEMIADIIVNLPFEKIAGLINDFTGNV